jgi:hypothetical protein
MVNHFLLAVQFNHSPLVQVLAPIPHSQFGLVAVKSKIKKKKHATLAPSDQLVCSELLHLNWSIASDG